MSNKNLLHKNKLKEFKLWLTEHGRTILKKHGPMEVLRWSHGNGPVPIISRGRPHVEHFICNDAAIPAVRKFIQQS